MTDRCARPQLDEEYSRTHQRNKHYFRQVVYHKRCNQNSCPRDIALMYLQELYPQQNESLYLHMHRLYLNTFRHKVHNHLSYTQAAIRFHRPY